MRKTSAFLIITFNASFLFAQYDKLNGRIFSDLEVTSPITKSLGDSVYHFRVRMLEDNEKRAQERKRYFWFNQGEVKSTVGAYTGKVLHGPFEKFDHNGNLLETGQFINGLKDGTWISFHTNGNPAARVHWSNGWRTGPYAEYYSNGHLAKTGQFRNDEQHGKIISHQQDGTVISKQTFRRGVLVKEKEKTERRRLFDRIKKKAKDEPDQKENPSLVPEEEKPAAPPEKKRKKKRETKKEENKTARGQSSTQ